MKTLSRRRLIRAIAKFITKNGVFISSTRNYYEYDISPFHPYAVLNAFPTDVLQKIYRVITSRIVAN